MPGQPFEAGWITSVDEPTKSRLIPNTSAPSAGTQRRFRLSAPEERSCGQCDRANPIASWFAASACATPAEISRSVASEKSKPNRYPTTGKKPARLSVWVNAAGAHWPWPEGATSAIVAKSKAACRWAVARRLHFSRSCHKCICCKASIAEERTDRLQDL
jgi:hypothetical protein